MKRPAAKAAAEPKRKAPKPPEFWDFETNPSTWLGGHGNSATDRTKHKAKELTKDVAAGEQMFKACPGNIQCVVLSRGVFVTPGEKVTIEVTLTAKLKYCDFYVGLLGHRGLGTYDTEPRESKTLRRSTLRSAAAGAAEFARSSKTRSLAASSAAAFRASTSEM
ncbi:unnamed protein product [Effrenium voratum]|nr:unnamed protein product [Effrenium voratum]